jgi:adenylate cyclase
VDDLVSDPWPIAHPDTMPHMEPMTEAELSERAGTTPRRIRRLAEAGIVSAQSDGSYPPSNIQRVRLAEAIERSGVPLEVLERAVADKEVSFSFLDLLFSEPIGYSASTYRQLCDQFGWSIGFVQRVHEALGLPAPEPDDSVREDDRQMFAIGQFALGLGMTEAHVVRVLRVYGENLRRIAEAEAPFYHAYVEEPLLRSGMSDAQMLEVASEMSPRMQEMVRDMILWLYRRHQEHSIIEHVVEHVENALEKAGLALPRPAVPPAIAFLDLAGYTVLTERRGDDAAADLALELAQLVQARSSRLGGKPVKWLGDGVMFHFPDPGAAVRCMIEMVDEVPAAGLPPAHVGVNAGPVVFRDGDYFGRTVNVASRIAGHAGPGQVLVSEDVVTASAPEGVRFEPIGPVALKGLSRPVPLYRAARSSRPVG